MKYFSNLLMFGLIITPMFQCSKKKATDEIETAPTTTTSSKTTSTTTSATSTTTTSTKATDPITARLYVASNTSRTIGMYKLDGTYVGFIDLTATGSGYITAMTWMDSSTMLAFLDPGASGERILKISFTNDSTYTINGNWYSDSTNLSNVTVLNLFSKGFSSSPTILISKSAATLEAIYTNSGYSFAARSGTPYISSGGSCLITTTSYVTRNTAGDKIILASTGANTRLNVYGASNACLTSYNYTTSYPTNAAYSAVGVAVNGSALYVRYHHATTPVIASCAFDGTTISGCAALVNDAGVLGVNASNKEMVMDAASNMLYFPNWDSGAIMQVNASTGYSAPIARDIFTNNVNSLSIRPSY